MCVCVCEKKKNILHNGSINAQINDRNRAMVFQDSGELEERSGESDGWMMGWW